MFSIRKTKNGSTSVSRGGNIGGIFFMIIGGGFIIFQLYSLAVSGFVFFDNNLPRILISLLFFVIGFFMFRSERKRKKIKNLKKDGGGIIKKLPVSAISHYVDHGDSDSRGFSGYYLEIHDGDMIYCSDGFENAYTEGMPLDFFEEIYREYGFEYNEKYKQDVLKKIDEDIAKRKQDANSSGFFKKRILKFTGSQLEQSREYIEHGYEPEKMIVNGHVVSVGDMVDIYIDPDHPKNYWVDVDFLMEE